MTETLMHQIEKIPTFRPDELSEAAVCGIVHGVAKVNELLSVNSLNAALEHTKLSKRATPAREVLPIIPELAPVHDLLRVRKGSEARLYAVFDPLFQRALHKFDAAKSHQDTYTAVGISILVPVNGPEAVFAAGTQSFVLSRSMIERPWLESTLPQYIGTYQPRDVMIIRQRIKWLNGHKVNLPQMHHVGAASGERNMLAMDLRSGRMWLPGINLEIIEQLT